MADIVSRPDHVDGRHAVGVNVMRGDSSGRWIARDAFDDILSNIPPNTPFNTAYDADIDDLWARFDDS